MKSSWCSGRAECEDCSPTRGKGLRSPVLGRCPEAAPAEGLCSGSGWLGAVDGAAPAKPSPAPPLAACSTILQLLGRAGPCPGCASPRASCWTGVLGTCDRWQPPPRCGEPATTGPREGTLGPCPETLEAAGEVLLPESRRRADANRNGPFESSGPVCSAAAAPPRPLLLLAFCTLLMCRGAAALLFPPPLLPLPQPRRTRTVPRSGGRQAKPREAAGGARSPACPHSQAEHSPCRRVPVLGAGTGRSSAWTRTCPLCFCPSS